MLDAGMNSLYPARLDFLNRQYRAHLGSFIAGEVVHNDRTTGLSGCREMLKGALQALPDLHLIPTALMAGSRGIPKGSDF